MKEDYYCRNCKGIFQPINWMYPQGYNTAESGRAVCPMCGSTATEPSQEPIIPSLRIPTEKMMEKEKKEAEKEKEKTTIDKLLAFTNSRWP